MPEPIAINVVYAHLPPAHYSTHRRGAATVYHTAHPRPGCDAYAYWDAFSYSGHTDGSQFLIMVEPPVVLPGEYRSEIWGRFDHVFALLDPVAERGEGFSGIRFPAYDPGTRIPPEAERRRLYPVEGRENAICMINGPKQSPVPGELYSKRVEAAAWFHEHSDIPFDVYGSPPFELPNYRGPCSQLQKRGTLARYRYSLCYENCYDPVWSAGYLTEKILHCLECRTVPIYLGCSNIERYLPDGCYIDSRRFDSYEALDAYLSALSDADYLATIETMDQWVAEGGLRQFSHDALYDRMLAVHGQLTGVSIDEVVMPDEEWVVSDSEAHDDMTPDPPLWSFDYLRTYPFEGTEPFPTEASDDPPPVDGEAATPPRGRPALDGIVRRALYIGPRYASGQLLHGIDYGMWNFLRTFEACEGVEAHHFDPLDESVRSGTVPMAERLHGVLTDGPWDLIFFVPTGTAHDRAVLEVAGSRPDGCLLAWITDPLLVDELHGQVDWVLTPVREGADGRANILTCRWACNPTEYWPADDGREACLRMFTSTKGHDLGEFIEAARRSGIPSEVVVADGIGDLPFEELLYAFSRTAVSYVCGDLAARLAVEVAACRGYVLVEPFSDLADYFHDDPPGRRRFAELGTAHDPQEMVEKALYALNRERERETIAQRAYERVLKEHTWFQRLEEIAPRIGCRFASPPDNLPSPSPFIPNGRPAA
ncbi:glycosyltransferase [Candidatus Poribacteria bacterium]|nr:glycosyltransferase [Candidatus Poribacteria bacterium]MBT7805037.1 glycosyltransferase [Candidatus Poribacteria bacterium]